MANSDFSSEFHTLTGYRPFPWQEELYERLAREGEADIPSVAVIPTGLGKTNVIAVWLIALAKGVAVPRRLVYVVNRRTVVDQTTCEAEKLRDNSEKIGIRGLAISTLRGQYADNRAWSADPSRPAIIVGTVDMIGSRLLFSGYNIGFRARPLHAGFLGQDVLLVHDESHLEPAFQQLVERIVKEQHEGERTGELPWPKLRVMALSATARSTEGNGSADAPFPLTEAEKNPPENLPEPPTEPIHHVWRRLRARKTLMLHSAGEGRDAVAKIIADRALVHRNSNAAVLIFVRTLDDVKKVCNGLRKKKVGVPADQVQQLTGTMRGKERDALAKSDPVFARFLPHKNRDPEIKLAVGTVYLVCTSAGEVGIDISADQMVCDLSTFESMVQRLGRVNRFGDGDAQIDVVHPASFGKTDKKTGELKADEIDKRRQRTLELLTRLPSFDDNRYDASPKAFSDLRQCGNLPCKIEEAFAPEPVILSATDILFDAWAMTSIRQPMPGRPPVAPHLHGIAEWQPPETHVAWRQEVDDIPGDLLDRYDPKDLLDVYPLKPHEMLRDATDRKNSGVFAQLRKIASRCPKANMWIVDAHEAVKTARMQEVVDRDSRRFHGATVILPPSAGGLTDKGTLDGDEPFAGALSYDVADVVDGPDRRIRIYSDDPAYEDKTANMRLVRSIESVAGDGDDDEDKPRRWEWFKSMTLEGGRSSKKPVAWKTHVEDVVGRATGIVGRLLLPREVADAVILAARLHDHGKRRERFQITLGNRRYPDVCLAKSGRNGARLPEPFRHEFASVLDTQQDADFARLTSDLQDLVLHLIAAHHGRARPHFDVNEAYDPERPSRDAETAAVETPRRFARLQRKYGRWGLAYLESLLRAADWAASADPSAYADETEALP